MGVTSLREKDLAALMHVTGCVEAAMPGQDAVRELLAALTEVVDCDLLFWTRFDVDTPQRLAETGWPHDPIAAAIPDWVEHRHEHPICSGAHGPVVALSDVYSPDELHDTWLYQVCLTTAGWEHEIGLNLSHPAGQIHDIVISRVAGRDFDARDHLVLRLLHPHLDAALRRLAFPNPRISERELEVLALVRDGMTNVQTASRLGISEATVRKHLENLYARVGAHSRTQALALYAPTLP